MKDASIENSEPPKQKRAAQKRDRRILTPGRAISLYELMALWQEREKQVYVHNGKASVFIRQRGTDFPKVVPILWLVNLRFKDVLAMAMEGRIHEAIYPPDYKCRCGECRSAASKRSFAKKTQKLLIQMPKANGIITNLTEPEGY